MNQIATAMIVDVTMNTPPAPIDGMPMSTPATAGPMTRVPFIPICWSTTAFGRDARVTTSPVNAMRAGPITERPAPCTADATSSIQYSSTPKPSANATINAARRMTDWHAVSTAFFGNRSAMTPPAGARMSIGTPKAMNTPPNPALSPVSSIANHPRAICCAWIAKNMSVDETNSTRYCGEPSASNRLRRASPSSGTRPTSGAGMSTTSQRYAFVAERRQLRSDDSMRHEYRQAVLESALNPRPRPIRARPRRSSWRSARRQPSRPRPPRLRARSRHE